MQFVPPIKCLTNLSELYSATHQGTVVLEKIYEGFSFISQCKIKWLIGKANFDRREMIWTNIGKGPLPNVTKPLS